jgi:hypothetical protein
VKRTKKLREGVTELSFSKVESELKKHQLTPELPGELLTIVKQTGCLLIRHADPDREKKRDIFMVSLRQWFSAIGNQDACDGLDAHRRQVELVRKPLRRSTQV